MYLDLEEFLEKCMLYDEIVIFNEIENIEDKYEEYEIPKSWKARRIKDFAFFKGVIWVKI